VEGFGRLGFLCTGTSRSCCCCCCCCCYCCRRRRCCRVDVAATCSHLTSWTGLLVCQHDQEQERNSLAPLARSPLVHLLFPGEFATNRLPKLSSSFGTGDAFHFYHCNLKYRMLERECAPARVRPSARQGMMGNDGNNGQDRGFSCAPESYS